MIFLYIFLSLIILLLFLLTLNTDFIIEYREKLLLEFRILFIKIDLSWLIYKMVFGPEKEKKVKKARKKTEKPQKLPEKEKKKKAGDIIGFIRVLAKVSSVFIKKLIKYIKVKLVYINITLSSGDAEKTAKLYGETAGAVYCFLELLSNTINFKKSYRRIKIYPDYTEGGSDIEFRLIFTIKPWQVLKIGYDTIHTFFAQTKLTKSDAARTNDSLRAAENK